MTTVPSSVPALYPQVTCISSVVSCDISTLCFTVTKILGFICNVWNVSFLLTFLMKRLCHTPLTLCFILCVINMPSHTDYSISVIVNDYMRIHRVHFIIYSVLLWGVAWLCQFCVSTTMLLM